MRESKMSLNRRSFLQGTALALAARSFNGCSSDTTRSPPGDAGLGSMEGGVEAGLAEGGADAGSLDAPFGVWRAMRDALRTSPDSLADQAERLVSVKDAQGLFAFVRDSIATLPPMTSATEKSTRWGSDAALRGGAGTPRERADLLASLLQRAGFKASVVAGDPDGNLAGGDAMGRVYLRTVDRAFRPADPPHGIRSWVAALTGSDDAPMPAPLDPMGSAAQALFDALDPLLPSNASANSGPLYVSSVPLVALEQGNETTYLNPLLPDAVYGRPDAKNIGPAPTSDSLPTFDVTLLMARANDPEKRVPLVTASYTLDQLIGRQLLVQTQPAGALEDLVQAPLSSIVAFIPTIAVTGVDLTMSERKTLAKTGPWLTQGGDVLEIASNGAVECNGLSLGKGDNDKAAANIAKVTVDVNAAAFPQIELSVSALDGKGRPVTGLGAGVFTVTEDATAMSFLLRDNGVAVPRVLFLVDTTGSQPPILQKWADAVAKAVFDAAPDATAQVVNLSTAAASADGYAITGPAVLASALVGVGSGQQSNLYGAILSGMAAAPTLVVLLSDGHAEDTDLETRALTALAGGAPVLAITSSTTTPVAAADAKVMDSLASASGGTSVDGGDLSDPTLSTAPLSGMLGARAAGPYRLSYTAPTAGASKRTVAVSATAKGTGTYDVPAKPSPSAAVVGLYLDVGLTTGTSPRESYTRVLGGFVPGSDPTASGVIDAAVADARAAMLGSAVVSFEGAPPTLSTWLADSIAWRLATEPAYEALDGGDIKAAVTALGDVPTTIPREAAALHAPALPVDSCVIYEESVRAILFCTRVGDPPYRADILPFTRLTTATSSNSVDVFRTTLLGSLRMAVAESTAFKNSTVSLLAGKRLALVPVGSVTASDLPAVPKEQAAAFVHALNQYPNWYRFVASDGSSTAFWAVHPHGSCLGVLPDGSGGGENPCDAYKRLANVIDILSLFSDILGVPALNLWAEIGKLVALAGVETLMAFNYMPIVATSDSQFDALKCGYAKGLLGAVPVTRYFRQEGVTTLATNYVQATMVDTVVGKFAACGTNPCG